MEYPVKLSQTSELSLAEVLSRLESHDEVMGILLNGSTASGELTPTSDFDIALVFATLDVPARLITTWIDGRFAEVFCTTVVAVERIVADSTSWPADTSEEEGVLRWLRLGRIVHDPTSFLERAASIAGTVPTALPGEIASYQAWWKINYNVVHMRRYLASSDPLSRQAASLRFLYSLMDLVSHYFTVRRIPWDGEKAAILYWESHDPGFWTRLQRTMDEPDLGRKRERYGELAQETLALVGGLWPANAMSVSLGAGWGTGRDLNIDSAASGAADSLARWEELTTP